MYLHCCRALVPTPDNFQFWAAPQKIITIGRLANMQRVTQPGKACLSSFPPTFESSPLHLFSLNVCLPIPKLKLGREIFRLNAALLAPALTNLQV
jgi:hypothetical protein